MRGGQGLIPKADHLSLLKQMPPTVPTWASLRLRAQRAVYSYLTVNFTPLLDQVKGEVLSLFSGFPSQAENAAKGLESCVRQTL